MKQAAKIFIGGLIFIVGGLILVLLLATIWLSLTFASIFDKKLRDGKINEIMNKITHNFTDGLIPNPDVLISKKL